MLPVFCGSMKADNTLMIKTAYAIASHLKANAVMVHADPLEDLTFKERIPRRRIPLILLSRKKQPAIGFAKRPKRPKRPEIGTAICCRGGGVSHLPNRP